jgi:hypothetical protein
MGKRSGIKGTLPKKKKRGELPAAGLTYKIRSLRLSLMFVD